MLWKTRTPGYKNISVQEAKAMLDSNSDLLLLDVRTPSEYAGGHLKGAKLIPDYEVALRQAELGSKDTMILIYCRSGARASGAARTLSDLGFTNIYTFGGIMSWPYEIER